MFRNVAKTIISLLVLVIAVATIMLVALSLKYSPEYARRLLLYGESNIKDYLIFPEREIENDDQVSTLETAYSTIPQTVMFSYDGKEHSEDLETLIRRTDPEAFIILQNDKVIYEAYLNSARDSIHTSFSMAKSFDSALIGAAIADGDIASVDDPVIKYIPEIAGRGLDRLTIRDLLLMNSGIRYLENEEIPFYKTPFGDDALTYYSPDLRKLALSVQASDIPIGRAFHYNNYHPLLEGLILERVTGMHVSEYLQEKFWKPIGAEFPASWSLDSQESGFEKMESGINARAMDYARFGLIFLHDGYWNGVRILPENWVKESTSPLNPDPRIWESMPDWPSYGGYYKYHWWGLKNQDGTYDFYAHGKYDQLIYIAPRKNVVVVRLGNAPDEKLLWPLVLHNLADQLP
jgi:CubicO group peptidase (beta-lactamase class C family)